MKSIPSRHAVRAALSPTIAAILPVLLLSLLAAGHAHASACNGSCDTVRDIAIDRSGRIVLAGGCEGPTGGFGNSDLTVWRLNENGTPDAGFGTGGVVHGPMTGEAGAVLVATDGTLFVLYVSAGELVVARYAEDGEVIGQVPVNSDDVWHDRTSSLSMEAAIDSAGGGVVIDSRPQGGDGGLMPHPVLRRFNLDGTVDTLFARSVPATQDAPPPATFLSEGRGIAIDSVGRIVVVGSSTYERPEVDGAPVNGSVAGVRIWRSNPDGTPDAAFGEGGVVTRNDPVSDYNDSASAVAIDDADRILVIGGSWTGSMTAMTVWRFAPNGMLDHTFGEQGRIVFRVPSDREGTGRAMGTTTRIDSASRIVVFGFISDPDQHAAVWRYLPTGSPDDTFGENGLVEVEMYVDIPPRRRIHPTMMAVDSEGRIVLAGSLTMNEFDIFVLRLSADGSLDRSFGIDGVVNYDRYFGFRGLE